MQLAPEISVRCRFNSLTLMGSENIARFYFELDAFELIRNCNESIWRTKKSFWLMQVAAIAVGGGWCELETQIEMSTISFPSIIIGYEWASWQAQSLNKDGRVFEFSITFLCNVRKSGGKCKKNNKKKKKQKMKMKSRYQFSIQIEMARIHSGRKRRRKRRRRRRRWRIRKDGRKELKRRRRRRKKIDKVNKIKRKNCRGNLSVFQGGCCK